MMYFTAETPETAGWRGRGAWGDCKEMLMRTALQRKLHQPPGGGQTRESPSAGPGGTTGTEAPRSISDGMF